jgi:tetratricopeptide (TPR) repeat protein
MAIRGNLSEASLADVLQLLAIGQKTGCLSLAGEGSFGSIHFDRGRIVHAGVVNRSDRLGDRLVRRGAVAADTLARVLATANAQDDRDVADALLAAGAVDRDTLEPLYRAGVEDAVYHLFGWTHGTFTFEAESRPSTRDVLISVSADSLLLEGARRVDEWTLIAKKIPSLDLIFEVDAARVASREAALSSTQQRIIGMVDGTVDVSTIIERSGLGEFEVGKAIFGLVTAGFAHRVGRSAARRQPSPENRVAEHRNLGVAFYRTGMFDEAQREFRRVLELREEDGGARFYLALVQLQKGAWQDAVETLRRSAREPDAPAAAFHNLAYALERLGQLDDAADMLAEAARRGVGNDPRVALSLGVIALKRGEPAAADEHLSAARKEWGARQPSAAWFHAAGLAAAMLGDLSRAIAMLEEGIEIHPHAVVLHNNLAVVQERHGSYERAARTLEHALLEDANVAHLYKNLGDYQYRAQRYDDALGSFTRVVRLDAVHGPDVYLKLGNIYYRRGAIAEARKAWEQALGLDPANRIVRANLDSLRRNAIKDESEDSPADATTDESEVMAAAGAPADDVA